MQPGGRYAQAVKSNRHQAGYWGELLAARVQCFCVCDARVTGGETCRFDLLHGGGRVGVGVGVGVVGH